MTDLFLCLLLGHAGRWQHSDTLCKSWVGVREFERLKYFKVIHVDPGDLFSHDKRAYGARQYGKSGHGIPLSDQKSW